LRFLGPDLSSIVIKKALLARLPAGQVRGVKAAKIKAQRAGDGSLQAVLRISDSAARIIDRAAESVGASSEDVLRWALAEFDKHLIASLIDCGMLLDDWRFTTREQAEEAAALYAATHDGPIFPAIREGKRWRVG
jgi:hypothetical protein